MRVYMFLSGVMILALGGFSQSLLEKPDAVGFLTGAVQLGGGILICGLFSMKMHWHGVIGAGVLAMLGVARGLGNFPRLAGFLVGERPHGAAPLLELGVTVICLVLFLNVTRALFQERVRRMLDQEE